MNIMRHLLRRVPPVFMLAGATLILGPGARPSREGQKQTTVGDLAVARIFFEYNSSDNDLGVHVFLDGEDWNKLRIVNPEGVEIFEVEGKGGYHELGLTELFFEGAEPSLDEVPLEALLALFPEGKYQFSAKTVEEGKLLSAAAFSHAVPDGPDVHTQMGALNLLQISWDRVTGPAEGFPDQPIEIVGYQVIVGSFQVTLPGSATSVTVPPEFVETLGPGRHGFEVLAIEASGNQTITAGSFTR